MPEEQAFCVLVKLMYDYGLRDLYKDRFDNLHMRFYQLNRLIEVNIASLLYEHVMIMFKSPVFNTFFAIGF